MTPQAYGQYDVLTLSFRILQNRTRQVVRLSVYKTIGTAKHHEFDVDFAVRSSTRRALLSAGALLLFGGVYVFSTWLSGLSNILSEAVVKDLSIVFLTISVSDFLSQAKSFFMGDQ